MASNTHGENFGEQHPSTSHSPQDVLPIELVEEVSKQAELGVQSTSTATGDTEQISDQGIEQVSNEASISTSQSLENTEILGSDNITAKEVELANKGENNAAKKKSNVHFKEYVMVGTYPTVVTDIMSDSESDPDSPRAFPKPPVTPPCESDSSSEQSSLIEIKDSVIGTVKECTEVKCQTSDNGIEKIKKEDAFDNKEHVLDNAEMQKLQIQIPEKNADALAGETNIMKDEKVITTTDIPKQKIKACVNIKDEELPVCSFSESSAQVPDVEQGEKGVESISNGNSEEPEERKVIRLLGPEHHVPDGESIENILTGGLNKAQEHPPSQTRASSVENAVHGVQHTSADMKETKQIADLVTGTQVHGTEQASNEASILTTQSLENTEILGSDNTPAKELANKGEQNAAKKKSNVHFNEYVIVGTFPTAVTDMKSDSESDQDSPKAFPKPPVTPAGERDSSSEQSSLTEIKDSVIGTVDYGSSNLNESDSPERVEAEYTIESTCSSESDFKPKDNFLSIKDSLRKLPKVECPSDLLKRKQKINACVGIKDVELPIRSYCESSTPVLDMEQGERGVESTSKGKTEDPRERKMILLLGPGHPVPDRESIEKILIRGLNKAQEQQHPSTRASSVKNYQQKCEQDKDAHLSALSHNRIRQSPELDKSNQKICFDGEQLKKNSLEEGDYSCISSSDREEPGVHKQCADEGKRTSFQRENACILQDLSSKLLEAYNWARDQIPRNAALQREALTQDDSVNVGFSPDCRDQSNKVMQMFPVGPGSRSETGPSSKNDQSDEICTSKNPFHPNFVSDHAVLYEIKKTRDEEDRAGSDTFEKNQYGEPEHPNDNEFVWPKSTGIEQNGRIANSENAAEEYSTTEDARSPHGFGFDNRRTDVDGQSESCGQLSKLEQPDFNRVLPVHSDLSYPGYGSVGFSTPQMFRKDHAMSHHFDKSPGYAAFEYSTPSELFKRNQQRSTVRGPGYGAFDYSTPSQLLHRRENRGLASGPGYGLFVHSAPSELLKRNEQRRMVTDHGPGYGELDYSPPSVIFRKEKERKINEKNLEKVSPGYGELEYTTPSVLFGRGIQRSEVDRFSPGHCELEYTTPSKLFKRNKEQFEGEERSPGYGTLDYNTPSQLFKRKMEHSEDEARSPGYGSFNYNTPSKLFKMDREQSLGESRSPGYGSFDYNTPSQLFKREMEHLEGEARSPGYGSFDYNTPSQLFKMDREQSLGESRSPGYGSFDYNTPSQLFKREMEHLEGEARSPGYGSYDYNTPSQLFKREMEHLEGETRSPGYGTIEYNSPSKLFKREQEQLGGDSRTLGYGAFEYSTPSTLFKQDQESCAKEFHSPGYGKFEYSPPSVMFRKRQEQANDHSTGYGLFQHENPSQILKKIEMRDNEGISSPGYGSFSFSSPSELFRREKERDDVIDNTKPGYGSFIYSTPSGLLRREEDRSTADKQSPGYGMVEYTSPSKLFRKREPGDNATPAYAVFDYSSPSELLDRRVKREMIEDNSPGYGSFDYSRPSDLIRRSQDRASHPSLPGYATFEYSTPSVLLEQFNNQFEDDQQSQGKSKLEMSTQSHLKKVEKIEQQQFSSSLGYDQLDYRNVSQHELGSMQQDVRKCSNKEKSLDEVSSEISTNKVGTFEYATPSQILKQVKERSPGYNFFNYKTSSKHLTKSLLEDKVNERSPGYGAFDYKTPSEQVRKSLLEDTVIERSPGYGAFDYKTPSEHVRKSLLEDEVNERSPGYGAFDYKTPSEHVGKDCLEGKVKQRTSSMPSVRSAMDSMAKQNNLGFKTQSDVTNYFMNLAKGMRKATSYMTSESEPAFVRPLSESQCSTGLMEGESSNSREFGTAEVSSQSLDSSSEIISQHLAHGDGSSQCIYLTSTEESLISTTNESSSDDQFSYANLDQSSDSFVLSSDIVHQSQVPIGFAVVEQAEDEFNSKTRQAVSEKNAEVSVHYDVGSQAVSCAKSERPVADVTDNVNVQELHSTSTLVFDQHNEQRDRLTDTSCELEIHAQDITPIHALGYERESTIKLGSRKDLGEIDAVDKTESVHPDELVSRPTGTLRGDSVTLDISSAVPPDGNNTTAAKHGEDGGTSAKCSPLLEVLEFVTNDDKDVSEKGIDAEMNSAHGLQDTGDGSKVSFDFSGDTTSADGPVPSSGSEYNSSVDSLLPSSENLVPESSITEVFSDKFSSEYDRNIDSVSSNISSKDHHDKTVEKDSEIEISTISVDENKSEENNNTHFLESVLRRGISSVNSSDSAYGSLVSGLSSHRTIIMPSFSDCESDLTLLSGISHSSTKSSGVGLKSTESIQISRNPSFVTWSNASIDEESKASGPNLDAVTDIREMDMSDKPTASDMSLEMSHVRPLHEVSDTVFDQVSPDKKQSKGEAPSDVLLDMSNIRPLHKVSDTAFDQLSQVKKQSEGEAPSDVSLDMSNVRPLHKVSDTAFDQLSQVKKQSEGEAPSDVSLDMSNVEPQYVSAPFNTSSINQLHKTSESKVSAAELEHNKKFSVDKGINTEAAKELPALSRLESIGELPTTSLNDLFWSLYLSWSYRPEKELGEDVLSGRSTDSDFDVSDSVMQKSEKSGSKYIYPASSTNIETCSSFVEKELMDSQNRKLHAKISTLTTENKLLKEKYNRATAKISKLEHQLASFSVESSASGTVTDNKSDIVITRQSSSVDQNVEFLQGRVEELSQHNDELKSQVCCLERQLDKSQSEMTAARESWEMKAVEDQQQEVYSIKAELQQVKSLLEKSEKHVAEEEELCQQAQQQVLRLTEVNILVQQQLETKLAVDTQIKSLEKRLKVTENRLHQERADRANNLSQVEEKLLSENAQLQSVEKELSRQLEREKDRCHNFEQRIKDSKDENDKLRMSLPFDEATLLIPHGGYEIPYGIYGSQHFESRRFYGDYKYIMSQMEKENGLKSGQEQDIICELWSKKQNACYQLQEFELLLQDLDISDNNITHGLKILIEERSHYEVTVSQMEEKLQDAHQERITIESTYKEKLADLVGEKHEAAAQLKLTEDLIEAIHSENQILKQAVSGMPATVGATQAISGDGGIEMFSIEIKNMENKIAQLTGKSNFTEGEVTSLTSKLQAHTRARDVVQIEVELINKKFLRDNAQYKKHQKTDKLHSEQISVLEHKLSEREQEILHLTHQNNDCQQQLQQTKHDLNLEHARSVDFEAKVESLQQRLDQKIQILDAASSQEREELAQFQVFCDTLDTLSQELCQTHAKLKVAQTGLSQERDRAGRYKSEVDAMKRQGSKSFDDLPSENLSVQKQLIKELELERERIKEELLQANMNIEEDTDKLVAYQKETKQLKEDLATEISSLLQVTAEKGELEQQLEEQAEKHDAAIREKDQTYGVLSKLEYKLKELLHQVELHARRLQSPLEAHQSDMSPEMRKISAEIDTLDLVISGKDKELEIAQDKINCHQLEKDLLLRRVDLLQKENYYNHQDIARLTGELVLKVKESVVSHEVNQFFVSERAKLQKDNYQLEKYVEKEKSVAEQRKLDVGDLVRQVDKSIDYQKSAKKDAVEKDNLIAFIELELKQANHNLDQLEMENDQLKSKLEQTNLDLQNMSTKNETLEKQLEVQRESLAAEKSVVFKLQEDLVNTREKIENCKQEKSALISGLSSEKQTTESFKEDLQSREVECDRLRERINELDQNLQQRQEQINTQLETIDQIKNDNGVIYQEYEVLCRRLQEKDTKISEMQLNCDNTKDELEKDHLLRQNSLQNEKSAADKELECARAEINNLNDRICQLDIQISTFGGTLQELEDTKRQKSDIQEQLRLLESSSGDMRVLMESSSGDMRVLVESHREEIQSLQATNINLQDIVMKEETTNVTIREEQKLEKEAADKEMQDLKELINNLKNQHDGEKHCLEEAINKAEARIHALETLLDSTVEARDSQHISIQLLEKTEEDLNRQLQDEAMDRKLAVEKAVTVHSQLEQIGREKRTIDDKMTKTEATVIKQKDELKTAKERIKHLTGKCRELEAVGYNHESSAMSSQQQMDLIAAENKKLRQVLDHQKQQLGGRLKKATTDFKQKLHTSKEDQTKLSQQVQQLTTNLEIAREQISEKSQENLKLQEEIFSLEDKTRVSSVRLGEAQESLRMEKDMQINLKSRFQGQEDELKTLKAFLSRKAEEAGDTDKSTWNEMSHLIQDLSVRIQDHFDSQKPLDPDTKEKESQLSHQYRSRLCEVESELSTEKALHQITCKSLQSLEEHCQRLRHQLHSMRRRETLSSDKKSKPRMEAINEIIARSQSQAQSILASTGYYDGAASPIQGLISPGERHYSQDDSFTNDSMSPTRIHPYIQTTPPSRHSPTSPHHNM